MSATFAIGERLRQGHDLRPPLTREVDPMLDYATRLRLMQEDREREIAANQRAHLAASGPPRPPRAPIRWHVGRLLLRAGMWLIIAGAPQTLRR